MLGRPARPGLKIDLLFHGSVRPAGTGAKPLDKISLGVMGCVSVQKRGRPAPNPSLSKKTLSLQAPPFKFAVYSLLPDFKQAKDFGKIYYSYSTLYYRVISAKDISLVEIIIEFILE